MQYLFEVLNTESALDMYCLFMRRVDASEKLT